MIEPTKDGSVRIAVFNIRELSTEMLTLVDGNGRGLVPQVIAASHVIQEVRPDVLLLLEIDHDYTTPGLPLEENARRFIKNYLSHGEAPIDYPYLFAAPNNTGILSGVDLDNNGTIATEADVNKPGYGNDCYGFGNYPGQYSMVVLSKIPFEKDDVRTFQKFLWKDMPGNLITEELFNPEALQVARLSSKSHWDLPIRIGGKTVHLLMTHPTPQGFDGEEDRNGRRCTDELRLFSYYIDGSPWITDDAGRSGGLAEDASFIVMGDLNAEPGKGSLYFERYAIDWLLKHPRVVDPVDWQYAKGALRSRPAGEPDFLERRTFGYTRGARLDYTLPSSDLKITGGGIHWPDATEDPEGAIIAEHASDHRLIWLDIQAE